MKLSKKHTIYIGLLLIYSLLVFGYTLMNGNGSKISKSEEVRLENLAIEQIKNISADFQPENSDVNYVSRSKSFDKWYAYIFDQRDGGMGYEVYFEDGNYTTTYNKILHEQRIRLIGKMDQLMPWQKDLNKYVDYNPYGISSKTETSGGIYDGRLGYIVVQKNIEIEKQLKIDYELLKYTEGLLKEIDKDPKGIWVKYYDKNVNDFQFILNKSYIFTEQDRNVTSFDVYFDDFKKGKIKEYRISPSDKGKIYPTTFEIFKDRVLKGL